MMRDLLLSTATSMAFIERFGRSFLFDFRAGVMAYEVNDGMIR